MLRALDEQQNLTTNQKKLIAAGAFGIILEFLDYFLIGFILTFIAKPWQLTFGTSSIILLSSGVGAMIGAVLFGWLADRIGRRSVFLVTVSIFSIGTFALIFTPESVTYGWIYLTVARFIIGFGAGGLYCVDLPLIQEFVPIRKRSSVSGLVTVAVPGGFFLGSALVAWVAPFIGWRGLMAVCVALSLITLFIRTWIPESPRWLLKSGRVEEARRSLAWALETRPEALPSTSGVEATQQAHFSELLKYPRSLAVSWITNLGTSTGYYGLTLWSPTLIVQTLKVPASEAAFYMIFVTLGALAGRVVLSILSETIGRRASGILGGAGAVVALVGAAYFGDLVSGATVGFIAILMVAYFFGEGGFAIVGPYSAEVWPSHLRATGMGVAYGFGGVGKIIGPLGLAFILGASTSAAPAASGISTQSAFLYFAAWYAISCVAFVVFGIETKGRSIEAIEQQLAGQTSRKVA
jgi:MFS transporter, putative metabolite:H+ symporter